MGRSTNDFKLGEFDIIERFFRPLSGGEAGALDLMDDAARLDVPAGHHPIVTCDALVEGVHFLAATSPGDIAHKAAAVNFSDLAAMGATPKWAFMALQLSANPSETWLEAFANGLGEALGAFDVKLMGGDTVSTPGPLSVTLTMIGVVPKGWLMTRTGAKVGDRVWVSGTMGGAALGLKSLRGEAVSLSTDERTHCEAAYRRPVPRVQFGRRLRDTGMATACIDISDGLVADLGHLCKASGVGATLKADAVPCINESEAANMAALTGGDDYELLFTSSPHASDDLLQLVLSEFDFAITPIGEITAHNGEGGAVTVLDEDGAPITLESAGWKHF